jgi:hypothetical protein
MASWIWATDANAGVVGEMTRFKAWGISWESWAIAKVLPTPTTASVVVKSVPDMVSKVLAAAGSDKITRLMLFGHSKSGAQAVGAGSRILLSSLVSDFLAVDPATGTLYNGAEQELAKLVPRLDSNARVSLGGCEVASPPKGPGLLQRISIALGGITVEGGIWNQNNYPGFEGPVVRCAGTSCTTITGPFKEFR